MTRILESFVLLAALAALAASCGKTAPGGDRVPAEVSTATAPAANVAATAPATKGPATDQAKEKSKSPIPARTRQLVVGVAASWNAAEIELALYQRDEGEGGWRQVGEPWPGTIGLAGLAWGRGFHGGGAPAGRSGPEKREGDSRSPAGVFAVTRAYGYAKKGRGVMPYTPVSKSWVCIDDADSASYNLILDAAEHATGADWSSAESMRPPSKIYEWVIEIGHNLPERVHGAGSCIFFHVSSNPEKPHGGTLGCTAMVREKIQALLDALDPAASPVYVLLPADEYRALRDPWQLPALE